MSAGDHSFVWKCCWHSAEEAAQARVPVTNPSVGWQNRTWGCLSRFFQGLKACCFRQEERQKRNNMWKKKFCLGETWRILISSLTKHHKKQIKPPSAAEKGRKLKQGKACRHFTFLSHLLWDLFQVHSSNSIGLLFDMVVRIKLADWSIYMIALATIASCCQASAILLRAFVPLAFSAP